MGVIDEYIAGFRASAFQEFRDRQPWELTQGSVDVVERLLNRLGEGYLISGNVAVHLSATVEDAATLKGPAIIGPDYFIAAGAYVRGGCWLEGG
jgi:UDP-N-acetylglucosamine diphosphorylase / glucose-1-phosphate thymidylyltransferase / UDP-N-acetylgalactosamine diphosphorylase / glucosamine-1-phosphate N-acetyltransferase / galactosamine-1-phosphate N-acetyltransferase